ncbi:hypothetical protein E4U41_004407 [Claviceps citrina]|nr:hypothetical protein E4U41_004407 [Claviceps citrina]
MPSFRTWAQSHPLPAPHDPLATSVIPALLSSISRISAALRRAHAVSPTPGSTVNPFGDTQLNVDVLAEGILRDALAACPAVATASSEEDPVERPLVRHVDDDVGGNGSGSSPPGPAPLYTVAFDPLDGSSIIGPNWTVGTIIGIWHGTTALSQDPSTRQVAAVLGVYGPRTTAVVAIRVPGREPLCIQVAPDEHEHEHEHEHRVLGGPVRLLGPQTQTQTSTSSTRYFAPANLRAAADHPPYWSLVESYVRAGYTLRYSGGLVPDVVHALVKGHGVYLSPVTGRCAAKLRRLYELLPVALVVETAGGRAVDPAEGGDVLARAVRSCDERGGIVCGNAEEVEGAARVLRGAVEWLED